LTQPDQAGVFSELWVLGSQCDIYFGIRPRALGRIIYDRYRTFLRQNPPPIDAWKGLDTFTAYSYAQITDASKLLKENSQDLTKKTYVRRVLDDAKEKALGFGALSIFCVPAIMDVCLLTTTGRGFFLTAFMEGNDRMAASYALLASLLITAGVTGWVGSVGGLYLYAWAFDNMNFFLVQRLSGGFIISVIVSICGLIIFSLQIAPRVGLVFGAYVLMLSTYLNILGKYTQHIEPIDEIADQFEGVMSTMHRQGSPLTSGRVVLWRTIPLLAVSPLVSTFVVGYDLAIYLNVTVLFVLLLLIQYRTLCTEWSTWMSRVPKFTERDVTAWYEKKINRTQEKGEEASQALKEAAQKALRNDVDAFNGKSLKFFRRRGQDSFVANAAKGLPLAQWILEKGSDGAKLPDSFSNTWFVQLDLGVKTQQQMVRGLKEHSAFFLFRYAKYDVSCASRFSSDSLQGVANTFSHSAARPKYRSFPRRSDGSLGFSRDELSSTTLKSIQWGQSSIRSRPMSFVFPLFCYRCGYDSSEILERHVQTLRGTTRRPRTCSDGPQEVESVSTFLEYMDLIN
jgi:hypothetical protein